MMKVVPVVTLTTDPVICAVFGGVLHGFSVGLTLNDDFSTQEELDILGILVKRMTGKSIGSFFIFFNVSLQLVAGMILAGRTLFIVQSFFYQWSNGRLRESQAKACAITSSNRKSRRCHCNITMCTSARDHSDQ